MARLSRTGYFKAIKKAKNVHWSSFLSQATPQSLWTAKKLALGKSPTRFPNIPDADMPEQINSALLGHFFPSSPTPTPPSFPLHLTTEPSPLPSLIPPLLQQPPPLP